MNYSLATQKTCINYSESLQNSKQQLLLRYTEETLELWYAEQRCTLEILARFSSGTLCRKFSKELKDVNARYLNYKYELTHKTN